MTVSSPGPAVIARARRGLSTDRNHHVQSLVTACRAALAERDPLVAWLSADRLIRITGGHEATPYLLRSAALAMLGDQAAAQRDIEAAIAANPEHPEVLEIMLRGPDAARREAAARHLAPRPDALAALAAGGTSGYLRFQRMDGILNALGFWNGDPRLTVTLAHEHGTASHDMEGQALEAGAFRWQGTLSLPWPGDARVVTITGDRPDLRIEPTQLHALPAPPQPTRRALPELGSTKLMIIVPVHGDLEATRACFEFLGAIRPSGYRLRVVAVDDASPVPEIANLLDRLAAERRIILLRHRFNLGFAAAVNNALRLREPDEDVLLLNSDAYLPQGALETMRKVAHAAPKNGTVTPFSNNGEDVSLPRRFAVNPLPTPERIRHLDALAWRTNGTEAAEIPNGVGFCLYIRAAVIEAIGGFALDYERGYFEDVDFCLRAHRAGFRNLCAMGAFVGHSGAMSFGGEKRALVRRNLARVHARFPEYRAMSEAMEAQDPLAEAARRIIAADLDAIGPSRLILASAEVPDRIVNAVHQAMPDARLAPLVLRIDSAGEGPAMLELTGLDARFPGRLLAPSPPGDEPAWLAALTPEELILVDPSTLPATIGADLVRRSPRRAVVMADQAVASSALLSWCPAPHTRLVTSAAMDRLVGQQNGSPLRVRPVFPSAPAVPRDARPASPAQLAIIPGQKLEPLQLFLAQCADLFARAGLSLAIPGAFEKDLAVLDHPAVWLTGPIEAEAIPGWLTRCGIAHALFADRHFGLADPLTDHLRQHGMAVACFGPPDLSSPDAPVLYPAASTEAIVRTLAEWLARPAA